MNNNHPQQSILKRLRSLSPSRACTFDEALGLAERQAVRLGHILMGQSLCFQFGGITDEHIAALPRGLTPFLRSGRYESRPVARGGGQGDWSDHDEQ